MSTDYTFRICNYIARYLDESTYIRAVVGNSDVEKERPFIAVVALDVQTDCDTWASDIAVRYLSVVDVPLSEDFTKVLSIKKALCDADAFDAFMRSLPQEDRKGWNPQRWQVTNVSNEVEEDGKRYFEITFRVAAIIS